MRTRTYKELYGAVTGLLPHNSSWGWYGLLLAVLVAVPWLVPTYVMTYGTMILIAAIGAIGLNIVTGTAGLISLGHAGFLAVGAYAAGILIATYGWPLLPAILAAGVVSAASSLLVGIPSLRLKGLYLAITTLAFSLIVTQLITQWDWLTGGSSGLPVARPDLFGLSMRTPRAMYFLCLVVAILTTIGALNLLRSRAGRAWAAIRDYDTAASLMGISLVRYKLLAFAVSAFITGIAGALLALNIRYLNVNSFELIASIEAIAMIIVGGLGSVRGAILGAILITVLPEFSKLVLKAFGGTFSSIASGNTAEIKGVIYALVIMIFLRYEPDGLAHRWDRIKRFWSEWPYSRK